MTLIKYMYAAIDCPDPIALAYFYSAVTGLKVNVPPASNKDDVVWVELKDSQNETKLAFQKIPNFRPPTWPEGDTPQQSHMDFFVDDLDLVEKEVLKLGAIKTEFQPGSPVEPNEIYEFRVYLDPAGHPFCLINNKNLK